MLIARILEKDWKREKKIALILCICCVKARHASVKDNDLRGLVAQGEEKLR